MKKLIFIASVFTFLSLVICGCDSEAIKASPKNKGIIERVYSDSWGTVSIFRDTETGREYIVFKYGEGVAVAPRLPKEE